MGEEPTHKQVVARTRRRMGVAAVAFFVGAAAVIAGIVVVIASSHNAVGWSVAGAGVVASFAGMMYISPRA